MGEETVRRPLREVLRRMLRAEELAGVEPSTPRSEATPAGAEQQPAGTDEARLAAARDVIGRSLRVYNSKEIVEYYSTSEGLSPCERRLFERYLRSGNDILDIGVGGGRTIPFLSSLAARYAGIDFAENMVEACREKYPEVELHVADATDLSRFDTGSFDAVVFSFNGIDDLYPDSARHRCLGECARLLRPGGVFVFSVHNPRAVLQPLPTVVGVPWRSALRKVLKAGYLTTRRATRHARYRAFWRGEGYVVEFVHGGMLTYMATEEHVVRELGRHGFAHLETLGSTCPQLASQFSTPWYYYAFSQPPGPESASDSSE